MHPKINVEIVEIKALGDKVNIFVLGSHVLAAVPRTFHRSKTAHYMK
eukprot:SAG31_NODE_1794_length_7249_cov_4.709231_5_plen_47_part_00